jgi:sphingomyelin phosphodiesterase
MNDWSMRFNALVDRFSYTIRGQFYGHMHSDHISFHPEMKSSSNVDNPRLTGYYLAAPSLTTASDRVPEYRVMDVDFDTHQVLDYTQYR